MRRLANRRHCMTVRNNDRTHTTRKFDDDPAMGGGLAYERNFDRRRNPAHLQFSTYMVRAVIGFFIYVFMNTFSCGGCLRRCIRQTQGFSVF